MQSKVIRLFTNTAGVLLLAVGTAMFISNEASAEFVLPRDPILTLSMPNVFWIVGAAVLCLGLVCLLGKQAWLKLNLLLWFALNFWAYQLGLFWTVGPRSFIGYWGNLADALGISSIAAGLILKIVFLYLLIGASVSLLLPWVLAQTQKSSSHANDFMKIPCPSCGGKIKLSTLNLGQQIPCPNCKETITLEMPGKLKMTCVLCGENIEFPAHALGQKIPCPHCAKTITLLKPV